MSDGKNVVVRVGPGFLSLLLIVFITLKLTGYIAWSWLWVLTPLWLPWAFALTVALAIAIAIIAGLIAIFAMAFFKH